MVKRLFTIDLSYEFWYRRVFILFVSGRRTISHLIISAETVEKLETCVFLFPYLNWQIERQPPHTCCRCDARGGFYHSTVNSAIYLVPFFFFFFYYYYYYYCDDDDSLCFILRERVRSSHTLEMLARIYGEHELDIFSCHFSLMNLISNFPNSRVLENFGCTKFRFRTCDDKLPNCV